MTTRTTPNARMLALAAGTALASMAVTGCATQSAPRADYSASRADVALKKGKTTQAIAHAEAAVAADPRNAAYRAMLGAAYMDAGRFVAARTSFDDALKLGDNTPRTALGFALSASAAGDQPAALSVLTDWQDQIPAADLGLAFALAGAPQQGVQVLTDAIRSGDNTPKVRQNLAYALALGGNWGSAKIMAAQDVPGDQLNARMAEWAQTAAPEMGAARVAALLGTKVSADPGQPAALALASEPAVQQAAAEAAAYAPPAPDAPAMQQVAVADAGELPALAAPVPMAPVMPAPMPQAAPQPAPQVAVATPAVAAPRDFETAFAAPAPVAATPAAMMQQAAQYAAQPVVQQTATRLGSVDAKVAPRRTPVRDVATPAGSHLVQLGSFSSEAGARRAWGIYAKQFPQLAGYDMVITKAVVRGKTYFRVSAGGLARAEAGSVCSSVRSKSQGCFAWPEGRPLPGAIDRPVRMAAR